MRKPIEFASRTPVLSATLTATLVLSVVVFPVLPIGGEMLDVKMGYTYAEAVAAMDSYGERGRQVYAWSSLTLDALLPFVFVSFLAGFVYRFRPTERYWTLACLPLAAGVLDLCENIQVVLMLAGFPDVSAGQVAVASWFTLSKWYAVSVCLLLAATLAAIAGGRRVRDGLRDRAA
ncbi:MAG: hypothetical protein OXH83_05590 [Bryobacterales bacterium]|nr:hypothetical protein [Bryobacterales bacterium]